MIAVTAMPITIAVTTSAEGIGSTTRDTASDASRRAINDRSSTVSDISNCDGHDMGAGPHQREADNNPQNVAMSEQTPKPDEDQQKARHQNDV